MSVAAPNSAATTGGRELAQRRCWHHTRERRHLERFIEDGDGHRGRKRRWKTSGVIPEMNVFLKLADIEGWQSRRFSQDGTKRDDEEHDFKA